MRLLTCVFAFLSFSGFSQSADSYAVMLQARAMSFPVEIWRQPRIPDTRRAQFELKIEPVP